ncbi:MAG: transglutaminase-like domain-containing protein [Oscillospiraceae bacterium]|nr:transglutaminase-like domain-containing protein [Oscillospiraceae bacterium]
MKKIKIFKKFSVITIICAVMLNTAAGFASYADFQDSLERVFVLETTRDPDRYARLTADGNTIYAEGRFNEPEIVEFYISGATMSGVRNVFTNHNDGVKGSFSAHFSGIPAEENARVYLRFSDGSVMSYRVEYSPDVGWFFGDNGLSDKGLAVLENYHVIPPEISAYYISATLEPDEISQTLDKLREIVDEVTFGLDDDYQKAKALNQWVANHFYYDYDARDNEVTEDTVSIATTLALNRSVCIGIGNLYAALLEAAEIKALNIKGGVVSPAEGYPYEELTKRGAVHEWVAFWYEKENRWVYADPTWDRRGIFENGEYKSKPPVMKHFDISPLALSFDHRGDRAELRNYFGALEVIGNAVDDSAVSPQESEILQTITTTTTTTIETPSQMTPITAPGRIVQRYSIAYIITRVGAALAILGLIIFIFSIYKSKK